MSDTLQLRRSTPFGAPVTSSRAGEPHGELLAAVRDDLPGELAKAREKFQPPLHKHTARIGRARGPQGKAPTLDLDKAIERLPAPNAVPLPALSPLPRDKEMKRWVRQVLRPRGRSGDDLRLQAEHFALHHKAQVGDWLKDRKASREDLRKALIGGGVPRRQATALAETLLETFARRLDAERDRDGARPYLQEIDGLKDLSCPWERLDRLAGLDWTAEKDCSLSPGARALIERAASPLRRGWDDVDFVRDLDVLTADLTVMTGAQVFTQRLIRLEHMESVLNTRSASQDDPLPSERHQALREAVAKAKALMLTLETAGTQLESLDAYPHLQDSLKWLGLPDLPRGEGDVEAPESEGQDERASADGKSPLPAAVVSAREYVKARQSLDLLLRSADPEGDSPLMRDLVLQRLDHWIQDKHQTRPLIALGEGDVDLVDLLFDGAEWDEAAGRMKRAVLVVKHGGKPPAQEVLRLEIQHAWRTSSRALDEAMAVLAREGGHPGLPAHAFRAARVDQPLIAALLKLAPDVGRRLDLLIADCVRLSLHDPALTKEQQAKVVDDALAPLRSLRGLDVGRIGRLVRQGFANREAVEACSRSLADFSQTLLERARQLRLANEKAHPLAHAQRLGTDLLASLGIEGAELLDPQVPQRLRQVLRDELPWLGTRDPEPHEEEHGRAVLKLVEHIAILQVAVRSQDEGFTPRDSKGANATAILMALGDAGVDLRSSQAWTRSLVDRLHDKLREDGRSLRELCQAFEPDSRQNWLRYVGRQVRLMVRGADGKASSPMMGRPKAPAEGAERERLRHSLQTRLEALQWGDSFTLAFGRRAGLEVDVPVVPGVSTGVDVEVEGGHELMVRRLSDGRYAVHAVSGGGVSAGLMAGLTRGLLKLRVGASGQVHGGHDLVFSSLDACRTYLLGLGDGPRAEGGLEGGLEGAQTVSTTRRREARAEVTTTASLDLMIAQLEAEMRLGAGHVSELRRHAHGEQEIGIWRLGMGVEGRASLAGGLASTSAGAGIHLMARRVLSRQDGVFTEDSHVTFTVEVTQRNRQECLAVVQPYLLGDAPNRELLRTLDTHVEEGPRLFLRCRLQKAARWRANASLGEARRALQAAAQAKPGSADHRQQMALARRHLRDAQAAVRSADSYEVEACGLLAHARHETETSRGLYRDFAGGEDEQVLFVHRPERAEAPPATLMAMLR